MAVRAFAKGALNGGGCARAASGGPAKRVISFLAAYALGPRNEAGSQRRVVATFESGANTQARTGARQFVRKRSATHQPSRGSGQSKRRPRRVVGSFEQGSPGSPTKQKKKKQTGDYGQELGRLDMKRHSTVSNGPPYL